MTDRITRAARIRKDLISWQEKSRLYKINRAEVLAALSQGANMPQIKITSDQDAALCRIIGAMAEGWSVETLNGATVGNVSIMVEGAE